MEHEIETATKIQEEIPSTEEQKKAQLTIEVYLIFVTYLIQYSMTSVAAQGGVKIVSNDDCGVRDKVHIASACQIWQD